MAGVVDGAARTPRPGFRLFKVAAISAWIRRALPLARADSGRAPKQRVGAGVVVLNGKKVLLVRRADNGLWDIPGGAVDPGEAVEDAARRELQEETALAAGTLTLLGVFSGPAFQHTYPDGNVVEWVTVLFSATWNSESPCAGDDAAQVAWYPLDALPTGLSPAAQQYLAALQTQTGAAHA